MLLFHAIPLSRNDTFQPLRPLRGGAAATPLISPAETTAVCQPGLGFGTET